MGALRNLKEKLQKTGWKVESMVNKKIVIPVEQPHRVSSPYGPRLLGGQTQFHDGIDFVSRTGLKDVLAIADGVVTYDKDDYKHSLRWIDRKHSAGNMIIVKHFLNDAWYYVRYLHLKDNHVSKGEEVGRGQKLGEYDDVGYSFGAHLHLDMYTMSWRKIDPTPFFGTMLRLH